MGFFDLLRGNQAQMPGQGGFFQDKAAMAAMASQLLGQQGNMANLGNAFGAYGQAKAQTRKEQKELAQQSKTLDFFRKNNPEYADMVDNGLPVADAWKLYTEQRYAQKTGNEVYGTPIYGVDSETGKEGVGVIAKDGKFRLLDTGGFNVARGVQMNDTGTGFTPTSKSTGAVVGPVVPIDNAGAAADKAGGKAAGEDEALYRSVSSKMPGLETVITKLEALSDKATYTASGQLIDAGMRQTGMEPREAAVARTEYIATVDNQVLPMLRDTFGAAFTVAEGETLRKTLGDPDKHPEEKKRVLRAFIEQKRRDVEALERRTGQGSSAPAPSGGGGYKIIGVE